MFEVIKPGLESSIQDLPGRIGYLEQGFPASGPMDAWSFRLANLLAGNDSGAAAVECQFLGPTLKFHRNTAVAITGANMVPKLDDELIPNYQSIFVRGGQTLSLGGAIQGARAYIAICGGINTPPVLGSRSTFNMAGVGGVEGHALKEGQTVPFAKADNPLIQIVKPECRPPITDESIWQINLVKGPNDDWIDDVGHETFFSNTWKLQAKSNRTGLRLDGPNLTFSEKATGKLPEHGEDPSNILDHGYPLGAVNLAGQTPIILANDGPSAGGFINPYTVPTAEFWKLAQSRPGDTYRFHEISVDDAQELRRRQDALCTASSLKIQN